MSGKRKLAILALTAVVAVLAGLAGARWWRARHPAEAWVTYPDFEVKAVKNIHSYRGKPVCQACHVARTAQLKGNEAALCQGCHKFHHGNHPVDVVQKVPPPSQIDLPLAAGAKVACHTCHFHHDVKKAANGLRKPFTPLCTTCHKGH